MGTFLTKSEAAALLNSHNKKDVSGNMLAVEIFSGKEYETEIYF